MYKLLGNLIITSILLVTLTTENTVDIHYWMFLIHPPIQCKFLKYGNIKKNFFCIVQTFIIRIIGWSQIDRKKDKYM